MEKKVCEYMVNYMVSVTKWSYVKKFITLTISIVDVNNNVMKKNTHGIIYFIFWNILQKSGGHDWEISDILILFTKIYRSKYYWIFSFCWPILLFLLASFLLQASQL